MTLPFIITALVTLASAAAAMSLRNLIHCALALTLTFAGLAAAYLQLGAEFVGLTQVIVYIGAVAILVVFAILLTRGGEPSAGTAFSSSWLWGMGTAVSVLGLLVWAINHSVFMRPEIPPPPPATVRQIGEALMNKYVLPLEVVGLLLTASLIGAVIIAMQDKDLAAGKKFETGTNGGAAGNLTPDTSHLAPPS